MTSHAAISREVAVPEEDKATSPKILRSFEQFRRADAATTDLLPAVIERDVAALAKEVKRRAVLSTEREFGSVVSR